MTLRSRVKRAELGLRDLASDDHPVNAVELLHGLRDDLARGKLREAGGRRAAEGVRLWVCELREHPEADDAPPIFEGA